jgi:predicted RNA methylase
MNDLAYRDETPRTPLIRYEAAKAALAEARSVDEVLQVRRGSEQMKLYARQAKDRTLLADATEIQVRAERKLGVMIISAKETGQIGVGRPSRSNLAGASRQGARDSQDDMVAEANAAEPEAFSRATLKEAGIDHKLSSQAQKWARLGEGDFDAKLEDVRNRIISGGAKQMDGARSLMASRQEAIDSLDFFPTPPWATRALVEDVLPQLGVSLADATVWEPACGEGHISGVLQEYTGKVGATDVFDYSVEGRSAPGWIGGHDFLGGDLAATSWVKSGLYDLFPNADWVITNPPFDAKAVAFVQKALEVAKVGVAMFFRSQWAVEGVERYDAVFRDHPPTLPAWFVERVNLCKGRWDPDGSTATAYCWLVWLKGEAPRAQFHIPPGRRQERWHDGDVERFTAHPVQELRRAGGEGGDVDPPLSPSDVIDAVTDGLRAAGVPEGAVEAMGGIVAHVLRPEDAPDAPAIAGSDVTAPDPASHSTLEERSSREEARDSLAPLTREQRDAVLREVYGRGAPDFAEIAARTGLTKDQAKKRANHIGVSSRDNQKAAVVASNKARAGK